MTTKKEIFGRKTLRIHNKPVEAQEKTVLKHPDQGTILDGMVNTLII